ncbi:USP6 N-terminal-like protein isoform X4 [Oryctolagus cuniculus]|uniref:USP6 N-terminal-like protein isoform X4 n=1 Tax=Oryctolagus cuniculus TaxID=9986 RepID=UPI0038794E15
MSSEQKLPQDSTLGAKCKQEMRRIQKWIKMMKNHRKYCGSEKEMKEQARLGASHFHHIDSTITWTFRNHLIFQERYRMNQHALFQVLMEYSVYNPEVGYSQGLSHVVGLLLVFMPEEDFLWALVQLMENSKHTMHGSAASPWPSWVWEPSEQGILSLSSDSGCFWLFCLTHLYTASLFF